MVAGPQPGLDALDRVDGLETHHLYCAARGRLLEKMGRRTEAAQAYEAALETVGNEPERRFLTRALERVRT